MVSAGAFAPVFFVVVPESEILLWPEEYPQGEVSLMIKLRWATPRRVLPGTPSSQRGINSQKIENSTNAPFSH